MASNLGIAGSIHLLTEHAYGTYYGPGTTLRSTLLSIYQVVTSIN